MLARQAGGALVMRVEDLDGPRVKEDSAERIAADLRWLGLDWDEGPELGGHHGPYTQSARAERYEEAIEKMRAKGLVFACSCSRRDVRDAVSAPHGLDGLVYPGTCRQGSTRADRPLALRFRHESPSAGFVDLIAGEIPPGRGEGDFVIRRADGLFAYQLAVVVDDIEMAITEVVRGDDLVGSTPRQIALYQALDAPVPSFVHVPLVMTKDGERLAKRHGATAVRAFRQQGAKPEEVVGMLARSLGIDVSGDISAQELIGQLELEKVPRQAVSLDLNERA